MRITHDSLAGLTPAGVICEIINDDGTMARVPDFLKFCDKHDLVMITVADLARYRFDLDAWPTSNVTNPSLAVTVYRESNSE